jgi:DnaJ-class molecular chaperone
MSFIPYEKFQKAVELFDVVYKADKNSIKKRYLELSKLHHPDTQNGDTEKFQEINDAYKLLLEYIENYRFSLSKEEFEEQYPFSQNPSKDWFYSV